MKDEICGKLGRKRNEDEMIGTLQPYEQAETKRQPQSWRTPVVPPYTNKPLPMSTKYVCYVYSVGKERSNWDDIMLSGTNAFRNIITSSNIEVPQYIRGFNRWYDMTAYSTALKVNLSSSALALFWSSKNDRVML